MAVVLTLELFDSFVEDLLAERTPRSLIIVAAAKVDNLLLEILRAYLMPKTSKLKEPDELLETPSFTFSSRIKMCQRLGLIDATLYRALERLRAVRNLCAHRVSFDATASPAREHFLELKTAIEGRASFQLTKKRYFEDAEIDATEERQCIVLTLCVLLEGIRIKIKRTSGSSAAMTIAAK